MNEKQRIKSHIGIIPVLRRVSLKTRLIAAFLVLAILPLTIVTIISMRTYSGSIRTKLTQASRQSVQISSNSINVLLSKYSDALGAMSVSNDVQAYLKVSNNRDNDYSRYALANAIYDAYSPSSTLTPASDVCVITSNKQYMSYLQGSVYLNSHQIGVLTKGADDSSPKDYVHFITSQKGEPLIAMVRKVYDKGLSGESIGYICILFNAVRFGSTTLQSADLGEGSNLLLIDSENCVLASQNNEQIGTITSRYIEYIDPSEKDVMKTSGESIIVSVYNSNYDIYSIAEVSDTYISSEIKRVEGLILSVAFAVTILALLMTVIISTSITGPITSIIKVYKSEGASLPSGRVNDKSPDELGYLARTIDTMADQNRQMLTQLEDNDRKKRELELEMLKYQINPHFLFNTLNTLKWIATLNNVPTLSGGISSLSSLLQSTLINKDEFIQLGKEIDMLKDYCNIQSLRYVGRFEVGYDISPECLTRLIPRFILQPLVENSILHGIHEEDDMVKITIQASLQDAGIDIQVLDDGAGFDVGSIMDPATGQFNGIGLNNVDSRLRLYYGNDNGLKIHSTPGKGTVCIIHIPEHTKEDDLNDV